MFKNFKTSFVDKSVDEVAKILAKVLFNGIMKKAADDLSRERRVESRKYSKLS